jgi:hypothetical protein
MARQMAACCCGWLLLAAVRVDGQDRDLAVTVRTDPGGLLLPNAEVIVLRTGERRFTSSDGVARLRHDLSTEQQLRVRQLGYTFRDVTVPAGATTLEVLLQRIPFALPAMRTRAPSACDGITPTDGALEAWALEQLRESAERYATFTTAYPFDVTVLRHTVLSPGTRRAYAEKRREKTHSGAWGEKYRRGEVVLQAALGFSVAILFVATLGDSAFWDFHCASRASVGGDSSARQVRLLFVPASNVSTPDWEGEAIIDSATSALKRVDFRLRVVGPIGPRRFEGYTTFREVSPFIRVPDTTAAMWWRSDPPVEGEWGLPSVVQRIHVENLKFRKEPR